MITSEECEELSDVAKPHSCEPPEVRLETTDVRSVDVDGFEEESTILAGRVSCKENLAVIPLVGNCFWIITTFFH